jgi:hypothetical protein
LNLFLRVGRGLGTVPLREPGTHPSRPRKPVSTSGGLTVAEDFNRRGKPEILDMLLRCGWRVTRRDYAKDVVHVIRPGKEDKGSSGTVGLKTDDGTELFCVFSTNAYPFPGPPADGGAPCSKHNKFSVFALLYCGGDYSAAARLLASRGYGLQCRVVRGGFYRRSCRVISTRGRVNL